MVLCVGDWELCPLVEDVGGSRAGTTLQLCFDGPGEGGTAVLGEEGVDDLRIFVFGVEEETVHVEEAGSDGWESGAGVSKLLV